MYKSINFYLSSSITHKEQQSLLFLFIFLSHKALFYAVYDVSPMAI